jgi:hypothetical protein
MSIREPSKDKLRTMWEAGEPLNSAWAEFAVLFDRAAQIPVSTHPTKGIRFFADDQNTGELHAPRNPKTARQTRGTRSRERSHMSAQICAGRLWAIGMRIVSTGADELVRIPSGHFRLDKKEGPQGSSVRSRIQWDKGQLLAGDIRYTEIRVFPGPRSGYESFEPQIQDAADVRHRSVTAKPRKTKRPKTIKGRPNTSRDIGATARRLWKTNLKFRALSLKAMVNKVRAEILGENCRGQEIVGYKSSSMEKTISRALKDLRHPTKRNKRKKRNT